MLSRALACWSLLGMAVLVGCVPPPPVGTSLGESAKAAVFSAMQAQFDALPHESTEDDNARLAAALANMAGIRGVEHGSGMLLVTLDDGEEIVIFNDIPYDLPEPVAATAKVRATHIEQPLKMSAAQGSAPTIRIVQSFSETLNASQTRVGLDRLVAVANNLGYGTGSPDFSSYANFTNGFTGMDMLVWSGHGGAMYGKFRFQLPTLPGLSAEHPDVVGGLLKRTASTERTVAGLRLGDPEHYSATEEFVKKYWKFKAKSVLIMNACQSGDENAAAFRRVNFDNGLEAFFGWSGVTAISDMAETLPVLVDLFTGANVEYAAYHPSAGPEKSRAWSYRTALSDLAATKRKVPSWHLVPVGGYDLARSFSGLLLDAPDLSFQTSLLTYRHKSEESQADAVWTPGITLLGIAESETSPSSLTIAGSFDATQGDGAVLINGAALNVTSWGNGEITCEIPNSGASSSGTVVVRQNGRDSNPVNITQWDGPVLYTDTTSVNDPMNITGSLQQQFSLALTFRADIHKFRTTPASKPHAPDALVAPMMGESYYSMLVSTGSYTDIILDANRNRAGFNRKTFSTGPGAASGGALADASSSAGFSLSLSPDAGTGRLHGAHVSVVDGEHVVDEFEQGPVQWSREYDQTLRISLGAIIPVIDPNLTLHPQTADIGFISESKTVPQTFVGGNGESTGQRAMTLQFGPFTVKSPPDPDAPR